MVDLLVALSDLLEPLIRQLYLHNDLHGRYNKGYKHNWTVLTIFISAGIAIRRKEYHQIDGSRVLVVVPTSVSVKDNNS
jgi:hypothetical protein